MIFVDPLDKCSALCLLVAHFEANRNIIQVKTQISVISFSPIQTIVYLDRTSKAWSLLWCSIVDIYHAKSYIFCCRE